MAFKIYMPLNQNSSPLRIRINVPSFHLRHFCLSSPNPALSFPRCSLQHLVQDSQSSCSPLPVPASTIAIPGAQYSDLKQSQSPEEQLAEAPRKFVDALAKRKVAVFWDLDNKPPRREAYEVAMEVRTVAEAFGEVVQIVAYANQHVFNFVPMYEREARQKRKELDQLELAGAVKPSQPYVCKMCSKKFPLHVELQNHILTFHERGRQQVARLLGSNKLTAEQRESLERKRRRYMEASRKVVYPEVGYNLDYELERAGVEVGLVSDGPQSADTALKSRMWKTLEAKGAHCFFLVSDDTDYEKVLVAAGDLGLQRVVVAETNSLKKSADVWLSWFELNNREARVAAREASRLYLLDLRQRENETNRSEQNIRGSSFQRVWRGDSAIRREGKCLVQSQHSSNYTFSREDAVT